MAIEIYVVDISGKRMPKGMVADLRAALTDSRLPPLGDGVDPQAAYERDGSVVVYRITVKAVKREKASDSPV